MLSSDDVSSSSALQILKIASNISATIKIDHVSTRVEDLIPLVRTFGSDEGQTPRKPTHEIWKPVWVGAGVVLADGDVFVRVLENRATIVVDVQVIRS